MGRDNFSDSIYVFTVSTNAFDFVIGHNMQKGAKWGNVQRKQEQYHTLWLPTVSFQTTPLPKDKSTQGVPIKILPFAKTKKHQKTSQKQRNTKHKTERTFLSSKLIP
jgi:hypothetical protein